MNVLDTAAVIAATPAQLAALDAAALADARRTVRVAATMGRPGAADALARVEVVAARATEKRASALYRKAVTAGRADAADRLFARWQAAYRAMDTAEATARLAA